MNSELVQFKGQCCARDQNVLFVEINIQTQWKQASGHSENKEMTDTTKKMAQCGEKFHNHHATTTMPTTTGQRQAERAFELKAVSRKQQQFVTRPVKNSQNAIEASLGATQFLIKKKKAFFGRGGCQGSNDANKTRNMELI